MPTSWRWIPGAGFLALDSRRSVSCRLPDGGGGSKAELSIGEVSSAASRCFVRLQLAQEKLVELVIPSINALD
jgi:hypothetical protein